MIINGDGGYSLLAAYIRGPAAQASWLGPKVGGHLAPCCIHCMNWVNSLSGLPWWQHHYYKLLINKIITYIYECRISVYLQCFASSQWKLLI